MSSVKANLALMALRTMSFLPLRVSHALGAAFGRIVHRFPNRQSRYIDRNLSLCFPATDPQQRATMVHNNMVETGKNLTELSAFWHWPEARIRNLVIEEVNRQVLDDALNTRRGVIVAAPHSGAWELIGMYLTCDYPMHFLYRPNKKTHLNDMILSARERFGGKCHPITARGLTALVRALKQGEMIGILPDQEPHDEHGVFAPLYGVPAYTMTFLSALARRTGAPVIFAVMERLPRAAGYRLHYINANQQISHEDPLIACKALNEYVEQCIDIAPTQYMWNYRRECKRSSLFIDSDCCCCRAFFARSP
ncbi:MAG: lysophospholipid acyltransferase family protein, partial [Pseudomonadota bacterium]